MINRQVLPPPAEGRLESWKEIASYLDRDVRTVQRWEKSEGLPVHRHLHDKLGSVYAFPAELDAWRAGRREGVLPAAPEEEAAEAAPEAPAPAAKVRRWVWGAGLAVVLVAAVVVTRGILPWRTPPQGQASVVVVPFENLSGDASQDYFSDGITEELITQLGRMQGEGAHIVALGSALSYRGTRKAPRQIARELGVAYVLNGTVRRAGNRVRVAAHLTRGRDEAHVWDDSYDCDLGDVLSLQNQVAAAIASSLAERLAPRAAPAVRKTSPEALEAHLKGRFFWNKRNPADLFKALDYFRRAQALDPGYAPSYVGLADCYLLLGSAEMGVLAPNEAMPKAREAVRQALAMDPDLAEAHASLAHLQLVYDWDWAGSGRSFRRALALNPSSVTAHQWYALLLEVLGRPEDALAETRQAAQLDPLSPTVRSAQAEACYFARRFPEAESAARAALEMDPNSLLGWVNLGRALAQEGRYPEAIAGLEKAWQATGCAPGLTMLLGNVYARMGDRADARKMLRLLQSPPPVQGRPVYVPAIYLAAVHGGLGEKKPTLAYLQKALEERCEYLIYLPRDPMADPYRSDPDFQRVLARLKLDLPQ